MKRNILAAIFILFAVFFVYGQNNENIDLVLLLNTSSGMSSSYENVNNYITGSFLSEFLRAGDTFHLIVFSQSPRLDIARRITQRGDVETIIGRMLLQYPVENGNNLAAAIAFTENYVSSLPSRPKKIVLVTTGGQDISNIVNAAKDNLRVKNTTFDFVQVTSGQPLINLPKSGRGAAASGQGTGSTPGAVSQGTASASGTGSASGTISTQGTASAMETTSQGTVSTSGTGSASGTTSTQGTASVTETASTQGTASATETTSQSTVSEGALETGASSGSQASGTAESGSTGVVNNKEEVSGSASEKTPEKVQGSGIASSGNEKTSGSVKTSNGAESGRSSASGTGFIILIILLILILGSVIFLISRRIGSGSGRLTASASPSKQKPKEKTSPLTAPASPEQKPKEKSSPLAVPASSIQKQKERASPLAAPASSVQKPKEKSSPLPASASSRQKPKEESSPADHSKELANYAAVQSRQRTTPYSDRLIKTEGPGINSVGPILLNMFVEDQSLSIGKRNIHSLKSGYSLSVGGGKSDFLIFLVPVPQHIGEIHRSGSQLTFIPRKHKYFPDLGSNELRDCLNKTIRVISDRNYEIRFRFETYEDPLLALNRVLHSIKVPG